MTKTYMDIRPNAPRAYLTPKGFAKDVSEHTLLRKRFYCSGSLHQCDMPWCHYKSRTPFNICPQCQTHFSCRKVPCDYVQHNEGFVWCPKCGGKLTVRYGGPYTLAEQAKIINEYNVARV